MAPERGVERVFASRSAEATENLGEQLGLALASRALIALDGDLGTGKTCFVRGLARGLGVLDVVNSPTYALLQTYAGRSTLHHMDAWMEGRERAFLLDGGLEWVASDGVTVVEWAERVADVLPLPRLHVSIERVSAGERRIRVAVLGAEPHDAPLAHVLARLEESAELAEVRPPANGS